MDWTASAAQKRAAGGSSTSFNHHHHTTAVCFAFAPLAHQLKERGYYPASIIFWSLLWLWY